MYFFRLRKCFLSTLLLELFCHILQQIQADILSTQRKNRNAYTFRFAVERETGFEPATPTLARLYSTPEPLAHFSILILLSARCTLQMILYRNSPHLSTLIFNFFQKNSKTSTIPSIFALHQTPAQRSSLHTFTSIRPPGESRLLASVLPPSHTHADPPSWQIQTPFHPSSKPHMLTPIRPPGRSRLLPIRPPSLTCSRRSASWQIQIPFHPSSQPHILTPIRLPGGSSRFTPVPTVRPRVASYLRCSGHRKRGREL